MNFFDDIIDAFVELDRMYEKASKQIYQVIQILFKHLHQQWITYIEIKYNIACAQKPSKKQKTIKIRRKNII